MKRRYFTPIAVILCLFFFTGIKAQDYSDRYGKVTDYELEMKYCPLDSSAFAVILYESGNVYYTYHHSSGFQRVMELKKRIKILSEDGLDYGNITIPYREDGLSKEFITKLEATVYNLESESGKIEKDKLKKSYIFDENISEKIKQKKATLPSVKIGSVIEYSYTITSDFYWDIPTWYFQSGLPVIKSEYIVEIPEYFTFNKLTYGYERFDSRQNSFSKSFMVPEGDRGKYVSVDYKATEYAFSATNIPPMKDENFIWNLGQYYTAIEFEIESIQMPYSMVKSFSLNWRDVDRNLLDAGLRSATRFSPPYKDEYTVIKERDITDKEKIREIVQLVKNNIKWSKNWALFPKTLREINSSKSGSNVDINSIICSILKDLGYNVDLIVLRLKSNGVIRQERPSLNSYDTFILRVKLPNNETIYIDGGSDYGDLNILPPILLVNSARVLNPERDEWVDLSNLTKNSIYENIVGEIDSEGFIKAQRIINSTNEMSYSRKSNFQSFNNVSEYIEKMENNLDIEIESTSFSELDTLSSKFKETINFKKDIDVSGDYIYFNPFIEKYHKLSNLSSIERKYPIEFNYPYAMTYLLNIAIPEGYQVEEMPRNIQYNFDKYSCYSKFIISHRDNVISIKYDFMLGSILILPQDYTDFRDFWINTCSIYDNVIVLKKIK